MSESVECGHVVRDFSIVNTRIKICDDYCLGKTPEEVDAILRRIAYRAFEHFSASATAVGKDV